MATLAAIASESTQSLPRPDLPPASTERGAIVVRFLTIFGRALQKRRVYPSGHPMRQSAEDAVMEAFRSLWASGPVLQVGVTKTQLLFDETATDPAHFALRDLAARLHRRRVGSLVFRLGVTADELSSLIERIDADDAEPVDSWRSTYAELTQLAFDALVLDEAGSADREVDALWRELVTVVSGNDAVRSLDTVLAKRLDVPDVSATVRQTMERLGRVAADPSNPGQAMAERQLGELLAAIPSRDLSRVLGIDPCRPDAAAAIAREAEWLPALALVDLIEEAAAARDQPISSLLLRMLRKMAHHPSAGPTARRRGEQDVRGIVRDLLDGWTLDDPSSAAHSRVLESLSRCDLIGADDSLPADDALRIVQMAVETDTFGDAVSDAVVRAATLGSHDAVVALADVASEALAQEFWGALTAPESLCQLMALPDRDGDSVARTLAHASAVSLAHLVDHLASFSQPVRSLVEARMLAAGADLGAELTRRLAVGDDRQRRLILVALQTLAVLPDGLSVRACTEVVDPALRLEAYRVAFRVPTERDDAMHAALADTDEGVVLAALEAGQRHFPRASLTRLFVLLNGTARSEALRAAAVEVLSGFDIPPVREWLLANVASRRGWFRVLRLAPKSPVVVAQIRALARLPGGDAPVARVLRLARRSGDPELIAAAGSEAGR